jgi:hypothetical protein
VTEHLALHVLFIHADLARLPDSSVRELNPFPIVDVIEISMRWHISYWV